MRKIHGSRSRICPGPSERLAMGAQGLLPRRRSAGGPSATVRGPEPTLAGCTSRGQHNAGRDHRHGLGAAWLAIWFHSPLVTKEGEGGEAR